MSQAQVIPGAKPGTRASLSSALPGELKGGPFGWIRRMNEPAPQAPAPIEMPTIDAETIRQARLREMRRMVVQNQGRESTILGGSNTTLGGA